MARRDNLSSEELEEFKRIEQEVINCTLCRLHKSRTHAVPGTGSRTADIMLVGEGPGKNEDQQGLPFVGAAGKFLDELLEGINLTREDVYITNVVKCRPPNNRDPQPDEIETCLPYLRRQTRIIKPKLICTLGRHAGKTLIDPKLAISREHGKFYSKKGYYFCALYHPAAGLYRNNLKEVIRRDFRRIKKFIEDKIKKVKVVGNE